MIPHLNTISARTRQHSLLALTLTLLLFQSCAGPSTLRKDGLSYLRVGEPMPKSGTTAIEGYPVSESVMKEEGYAWRICSLQYADGPVIVESDFTDHKSISRIRVETPEIKVKGGLRVGHSLSDLLAKTEDWLAKPFPKYQVIEMISAKYPRTIFLLKVPEYDYSRDEAEVAVSELPANAKVAGIVVM